MIQIYDSSGALRTILEIKIYDSSGALRSIQKLLICDSSGAYRTITIGNNKNHLKGEIYARVNI